jgi:Xaa-Pro aminopeptidase
VYTKVLKAFLNCYNSDLKTGYEVDMLAHTLLDADLEDFVFSHGLGHGIGINVHEAPPALNKNEIAKTEILDNMTFTIEPGLYNPKFFGVRLENSCYKKDGKIHSLVKMGYEGKLIDHNMLNSQEQEWLKEFELL